MRRPFPSAGLRTGKEKTVFLQKVPWVTQFERAVRKDLAFKPPLKVKPETVSLFRLFSEEAAERVKAPE
jgi:hypothetical protein